MKRFQNFVRFSPIDCMERLCVISWSSCRSGFAPYVQWLQQLRAVWSWLLSSVFRVYVAQTGSRYFVVVASFWETGLKRTNVSRLMLLMREVESSAEEESSTRIWFGLWSVFDAKFLMYAKHRVHVGVIDAV